MDFSAFRETGELSDISVVVEEEEFRLHKFPLFIRSDFFRRLAGHKQTEREQVQLIDFPGGPATFKLVANFCYNVKVAITQSNVCWLRCAAEYLQMKGPGNLTDVTDRFLQDALTSARLARGLATAVDLLLECCEVGELAEKAGLVQRCVGGIVDCWLMSPTLRSAPSRTYSAAAATEGLQKLTDLPLSWFLQLLVAARDKAVKSPVLACLSQMYIDAAMRRISKSGKYSDAVPEHAEKADLEDAEPGKECGQTGTGTSGERGGSDCKSPNSQRSDADIGEILDTLLMRLPEGESLADTMSPQWTVKMLQTAFSLGCKCRPLLLKLAARILPKLTPTDLHDMPPALLCDVIQQAGGVEDCSTPALNSVGETIDKYLLELAGSQQLSADFLCRLVSALPPERRASHDTLYQVVDTVLKSDKLDLCEADKQSLLVLIDLSKLNESSLKLALQSQLFPAQQVTEAALALCVTLRQRLQRARDVISAQEAELSRFGLGGKGTLWLKNNHADDMEEQDQNPSSRENSSFGEPTVRPAHVTSTAAAHVTSTAAAHVTSTAAALASAEYDYNAMLDDVSDPLSSYFFYDYASKHYQPGSYSRSHVYAHGSSFSPDYREIPVSTIPSSSHVHSKLHRTSRWYTSRY